MELASLHSSERAVIESMKLADDTIKEVRTASYLLYPPLLDEMGLSAAVRVYLEGFTGRSNIQTTFDVASDFSRLSPDAELVLFRVIQECLTNIRRHSGSTTARIYLAQTDEEIVLEIEDAGKGISSDAPVGVGLAGMEERMRQLGGRLAVSSTANGTVVTASIPVSAS